MNIFDLNVGDIIKDVSPMWNFALIIRIDELGLLKAIRRRTIYWFCTDGTIRNHSYTIAGGSAVEIY